LIEAPEILTDSAYGGYGPACDLWSLGVILYILYEISIQYRKVTFLFSLQVHVNLTKKSHRLCGYPPFKDNPDVSIYEQIKTANFVFDKDWDNISEEGRVLSLCSSVLNKNKFFLLEFIKMDLCG
jgi:serine/threonine protein kinase